VGYGPGGQLDLPRPGAVTGQRLRHGLLVGDLRGIPAEPAQRVGGQQVLHRQLAVGSQGGHHRARRRQALGRGGVALGPAVRRGRPVRGRPAGGLRQLAVGAGPRPGHRSQPVLLVPPRLPAGEPADLDQLGVVGRVRPGRVDDGRVRQHSPRRQVGDLGDPVPGVPQLPHHGQAAAGLHPVNTRGAAPRVRPGRGRAGREHRLELLAGPLRLALLGQLGRESVTEVGQHLHIEGGVAEQFLAERAGRPVGGRVTLFQVEAEHLLDQRAEGHPRVAEQPAGQLGIEEPLRPVADLGQAWQVLRRRVQHRLGAGQRGIDAGQLGAGDRVDEDRA
jgi:hypothetical protein